MVPNKVIFIEGRKDLNYQTMQEYSRFDRRAANDNSLDCGFDKLQLEKYNKFQIMAEMSQSPEILLLYWSVQSYIWNKARTLFLSDSAGSNLLFLLRV